jgi:hypothetical protein
MEVRVGILLGRQDRHHIERRSNKHPLDRLLGTVMHLEGMYFLHCVDILSLRGLCIENHHNSNHVILNNNNSIDLFCRTDLDLKTLDQQILPLELGALALRMNVGLVENPTIRDIVLLKRREYWINRKYDSRRYEQGP